MLADLNTQVGVEVIRDTKTLLCSTRKAAANYGGFTHPGIFQTAAASRDIAGFLGTIALESWTLLNLALVAGLTPTATFVGAAGLWAVDVLAAAAAHYGLGPRQEVRCRVAVATDCGQAAALKARIPHRHGWIRSAGSLVIVALAVAKSTSFLMLMEPSTPGGLALLVITAYALVAWLHLQCTGYAIACLAAAYSFAKDRASALRAETRAEARTFINAHRVYEFQSGLLLVPCAAHGHELTAGLKIGTENEPRWKYKLVTWGLPEDRHLGPLVFTQPTAEQKYTVARHFLTHQLEVLHSEPLGAVLNSNITSMPNPSVGDGTPVRAAVAVALACCALAFDGCAKKASPRQEFDMTEVAGGPFGNDAGQTLSADDLELLAPKSPYGGRFIARPTLVRLDQPLAQARSLDADPDKASGLSGRFWGHHVSADKAGPILRAIWAREKLGNLARAAAPASDPAGIAERTKKIVAGSDFTAVLLEGGVKENATFGLPDGSMVPAFGDMPALKAAVDAALASGAKHVAIFRLGGKAAEGTPVTKPNNPSAPATIKVVAPFATRPLLAGLAQHFLEPDRAGYVHTEERGDVTTVSGFWDGHPAQVEILVTGSAAAAKAAASGERPITLSGHAVRPVLSSPSSAGNTQSPGMDGLAICVGAACPVHGRLTVEDVGRLFSGVLTRWEELVPQGGVSGPIHAVSAADGDAATVLAALTGTPATAAARLAGGDDEVAAALSADPLAVGLLSTTTIPANVRALPVARDENARAIEPTTSNVALGYYPLCRELVFSTPARDSGDARFARRFIEYARSVAAQRIVVGQRFVSEQIGVVEIGDGYWPDGRDTADARLRKIVAEAALLSRAIHFASADATLDDGARAEIARVVAYLQQYPALRAQPVVVAGFTDNRGSAAVNKELSERRAKVVATQLVAQGIVAEAVGFGERLPIASNADPAQLWLNRRAEILVKRIPGMASQTAHQP